MPDSALPFPTRTSRIDRLAEDGAPRLKMELPAAEVDARLVAFGRVHRSAEAVVCFFTV